MHFYFFVSVFHFSFPLTFFFLLLFFIFQWILYVFFKSFLYFFFHSFLALLKSIKKRFLYQNLFNIALYWFLNFSTFVYSSFRFFLLNHFFFRCNFMKMICKRLKLIYGIDVFLCLISQYIMFFLMIYFLKYYTFWFE